MANQLMDDFYMKCLQQFQKDDIKNIYKFTKMDNLEDESSEFQQLLKPLKINIDAVDKSIPIPTPAKKKTDEEFEGFVNKFQSSYINCYQNQKLQNDIQTCELAQDSQNLNAMVKAYQETQDPILGEMPKIQAGQSVDAFLNFFEAHVSKLKTRLAEEDLKLLEAYQEGKKKEYDDIVKQAWGKAALPKFCWIQTSFRIVCKPKTIKVKWVNLQGLELNDDRETRFDPDFFGNCRQTCYDKNNKRFPKCTVLLGVIYSAWCNSVERKQLKENGQGTKDCHYTLFSRDFWKKQEVDITQSQNCPQNMKPGKMLGVLPRCFPDQQPKCEDFGYVPCMKVNLGCGQTSADCSEAINKMVTSSLKVLKFVISLLTPGTMVFDFLNLFSNLFTLSSQIARIIIDKFKVADELLTMNPIALNIRVDRASKNMLAYYKENPDPEHDKKTFADHKKAVTLYVDEQRAAINADPTLWDQILYKTLDCMAVTCDQSDNIVGKQLAQSGLKICRKCGQDIDKNSPFIKKIEAVKDTDLITYKNFLKLNATYGEVMKESTTAAGSLNLAAQSIANVTSSGGSVLGTLAKGAKSLFGWGRFGRKKLTRSQISKNKKSNQVVQAAVQKEGIALTMGAIDAKKFNENIKKVVGNMTISQLLTDGGITMDKESGLYKILNVLKIDHYFTMWEIKGKVQTYLDNVYQPKALVDQAAKEKQQNELIKGMLDLGNSFDPTGITGVISSFVHDDCPQFDPAEPEEQILPPPVPPPVPGKQAPVYVPINNPPPSPLMYPLQPPEPVIYGQPQFQPYGQPFPQPNAQPQFQPFGQPFPQPNAQPQFQPYGQPIKWRQNNA